jgi:hypothetical protein
MIMLDCRKLSKAGQYIASNLGAMLRLLVSLSRNISLNTQRLLPLTMAATEILNIEPLKVLHAYVVGA